MSDTEAAALEPDADARAERLARAQAMVADGHGADLMPDLFYGFAPISAARYASLVGRCDVPRTLPPWQLARLLGRRGPSRRRYGADDMFS